MLAGRLRRRPNIDPTLVQCLVFAGLKFRCCWFLEERPDYHLVRKENIASIRWACILHFNNAVGRARQTTDG